MQSYFSGDSRTTKCGMGTLDDFRFLRSRWEVGLIGRSAKSCDWAPYVAPGRASLGYADVSVMVRWKDSGRELKAFVEEKVGSASRKVQSEGYYFRPGITWPLRGSRFSAQIVPPGCTFSVAGKMAFAPTADLFPLLAVMNSSTYDFFVGIFAGKVGGVQYESGLIGKIPIPLDKRPELKSRLAELGRSAWEISRYLGAHYEISNSFMLPQPILDQVTGMRRVTLQASLAEVKTQIDEMAFDLYGITRHEEIAGLLQQPSDEEEKAESLQDSPESEVENHNISYADLISWGAGVSFGRFDLRLAIGERPLSWSQPFDPLPALSPGMVPEAESAQHPARALLVDDPGHPLDLTAQVGAVLERAGFAPENLRRWLARDFFPLHIKMYSKSRRKAPIYWQLSTTSASYSVWLYIHAFSRDALYQVQEIAELKLLHEERKLETQRADLGSNPTATARKELENQEAFANELRAFLEEVKRVAPLWNPNLDDGVIINFAPLWRLVPHHKPWQKELKATWDALCAGEYDWAHLAMYLWPERVVPKCATDRSLAIAHGLEEVFWVEGENGKWKPRPIPVRPVEELMRERTSPAVKAALKSLLEAPAALSSGGRGRPRRGRGPAGGAA